MTDSSQAQRIVIVAGVILMALELVPIVQGKSSTTSAWKQIWAIGVITLGLAAAADFAPQLVIPFAVAIVIGAALVKPGVLGSFLQGNAKTAAPAGKGKK